MLNHCNTIQLFYIHACNSLIMVLVYQAVTFPSQSFLEGFLKLDSRILEGKTTVSEKTLLFKYFFYFVYAVVIGHLKNGIPAFF